MNLTPKIKDKSNKISLNWAQLNAIIQGHSAIDLNSLPVRSEADAYHFALAAGWDTNLPGHRATLLRAHAEAVAFIGENFLNPGQGDWIDPAVREVNNPLDLLVYASNYLTKSRTRQLWACAVLKVIHGILHIDLDVKLRYFDQIRDQIFERLDRLIISKGPHHFLTDGKFTLPLFFFQKKRNKNRQSILIKLLQKPSYVASDIYDHLGVRLIFESKIECLLALKVLHRCHQISVVNLKPFRGRNNLLDMEVAKQIFQRYRPMLERSSHYPKHLFLKMDEELDAHFVKQGRDENPHSSRDYQAIQVTARQMVRVTQPVPEGLQSVRPHEEHPGFLPNMFSFYFDYEVQLMDRASFTKSMYGPASHEAYKKRQRETARQRVLGPVLIRHLNRLERNAKRNRKQLDKAGSYA